MFICFFALWVVLNGKWTTEIAVFGLVFATAAYAFTWKYMDYSPKVDIALIKRVPSALRYGVNLVVEIIKANLVVTKMILKNDFVPSPQLVRFDVDLKKNRHLVALANSITLTPGTITVDLHDNHFVVHALDASLVDGLDDGGFVQELMKMEAKHMKMDGEAAAPVQAEASAQEEAAKNAEAAEAVEAGNSAEPCEGPAAEENQGQEANVDEH